MRELGRLHPIATSGRTPRARLDGASRLMVFAAPGAGHGSYAASCAAREAFLDRLRLSALWMIGASSGFVMVEPAPYEFLFMLATIVFVATGLTLRAGHLPLMFLLAFYNIGFIISLIPVVDFPGTVKWTAVSCYLAVTTLFFALVLVEDTARRLEILMRGYILGAVITSMIAVLGYFELVPGWAAFIGAERARSTFKDPNVFGPFLILPALVVLQRIMFGGMRGLLRNTVIVFMLAAGLFLSFSRAAWGHFCTSALLMLYLTYVTTRSRADRRRIVIAALFGTVVIAAFIAALLSLDQVASLFEERASLLQDYDAGHTGRFGRHILGALMVLDHPFGIGPLQFSKYLSEDPHNSFLLSFTAGGWLGGFSLLALVLITLGIGLRQVFMRTPWQSTTIAVYAVFVGEVAESYFIDVQHWRHYYLIIGVIWGLVLAARPSVPAMPVAVPARS
jgi:hypothetical protein